MKIAEIETEDGASVTAYEYSDGVVEIETFCGTNGIGDYVTRADLARFAAQIAKAYPDEFQAALNVEG